MVAKEAMPDQVHLFVRVGPTDARAQVVRAFKGGTARVLRAEFPAWAGKPGCCGRRSYLAASVGRVRRRRRRTSSLMGRGDGLRETVLCVSAAALRRGGTRAGGVCGGTSRAVQRGVAGASGCVVAQQDPHLLGDQSAQLTEIRAVRPDQAVWSFSSQQATLRRLNKAFGGFFRRVKAGQKAGYPRFKGAARFDSVEWPRDGDGARWLPERLRVYLQGVGHVRSTCPPAAGAGEDDPGQTAGTPVAAGALL